jgi:competence ComEA-like helix-hairpin-helix protein
VVLTPEERRGVAVVVVLLLIGTGWDLWRASTPHLAPAEDPALVVPPAAPRAAVLAPPDSSAAAGPASRRLDDAAPIDLNAADAATLDRLPGVGPVLAARIVEHRTTLGAFERVEDLRAVRGIGPRLLERIRPHVVVRALASARTGRQAAPKSPADSAAAPP